MSKINAVWHEAHKMPDHPSDRQRAQWHYDHALNCGCRQVTPSIRQLLESQGLSLPADAPGHAGPASAE